MNDSNLRKVLEVCTSHVTKDDMDTLDMYSQAESHIINSVKYHYGSIIFVPFHDEPEEDQTNFLEEVRAAGYSPALCNLFRLAWEHDADLIRLDCDAMEIPGLPTFDW